MARDIDGDDARREAPQDATAEHNVSNRRTVLQQCCAEIRTLGAQANALAEQKKGINKQIGDVFRRIKSELGIKRKSVEAIMGLVDLKDEERNETLDELREVYEALRPGEQLDWISVAENAQPAAANGAAGAPQPA